MTFDKRSMFSVMTVAIFLVVFGASIAFSPWVRSKIFPITSVVMSIEGGLAYINDPLTSKVSIGFMGSYAVNTDTNTCNVTQKGLDLYVVDGNILEPAGWNKFVPFDPRGGVVTMDAFYVSNGDPRRPAGDATPPDPVDGDIDGQWVDERYVPNVGKYFQGNPLAANWQSRVDGYFVLTNGTVTGAKPSDTNSRHADWEFKPAPGKPKTFNQALTDVTEYDSSIYGDTITINMPGARAGVTKIKVQAVSPGRPIRLKLMGEHEMGTTTNYNVNDPISHFCIFYQLMDPIPNKSTWLIPHYAGAVGSTGTTGATGATGATGGTGAWGTPGAFCPGDSF